MPNELDRRFDEELAKVIGPGGRLVIEDEFGPRDRRPISRRRCPAFQTFCALNGANEAVVAGEERLSFADLDRISDALPKGSRRAESQGRPRRHCHAQLPGVDRQLHGDP